MDDQVFTFCRFTKARVTYISSTWTGFGAFFLAVLFRRRGRGERKKGTRMSRAVAFSSLGRRGDDAGTRFENAFPLSSPFLERGGRERAKGFSFLARRAYTRPYRSFEACSFFFYMLLADGKKKLGQEGWLTGAFPYFS